MALSGEQIDRFSRQILVPEVGGRGQLRLLDSTVTCLGDSDTLSCAVRYMSAAGVRVVTAADPARRDLDLLLVSADRADRAAALATAECPCFVSGGAAGTVWYSRHTTSRDCAPCVCAAANTVIPLQGDDAAASSAAVAGAALALDAIAGILQLDAAPSAGATLVAFRRGGVERAELAIHLDAAGCAHGPRSHRGKGAS